MSFYPFLGSAYERFKAIDNTVAEEVSYISSELEEAYQIYEICKRQYVGFGVLLQFWPDTNANLARKQLIKKLEKDVQSLKNTRGLPIHPNLSRVDAFVYKIRAGFDFNAAKRNLQLSIAEILSTLPFVFCFFPKYIYSKKVYQDWTTFLVSGFRNLLYIVLNPTMILGSTIWFIHLVLNRILEIGAKGEESSPIRRFLKSLVGIVLGICNIPVVILGFLIDGILNILTNLIMHFGKSLLQLTYTATEKQAFIASAQEMWDVKELRQAAKGREVNYSIISGREDTQTEHYGFTDTDIYSTQTSKEAVASNVVAIRAPEKPDKVYKLYQLLAIHGAYKAKGIVAQHDPRAINEAKRVLGDTLLPKLQPNCI